MRHLRWPAFSPWPSSASGATTCRGSTRRTCAAPARASPPTSAAACSAPPASSWRPSLAPMMLATWHRPRQVRRPSPTRPGLADRLRSACLTFFLPQPNERSRRITRSALASRERERPEGCEDSGRSRSRLANADGNDAAMRIAYITAGAAGMFCGSCMHDNTLVAALRRAGPRRPARPHLHAHPHRRGRRQPASASSSAASTSICSRNSACSAIRPGSSTACSTARRCCAGCRASPSRRRPRTSAT